MFTTTCVLCFVHIELDISTDNHTAAYALFFRLDAFTYPRPFHFFLPLDHTQNEIHSLWDLHLCYCVHILVVQRIGVWNRRPYERPQRLIVAQSM